jgi:hypothetical protein
LTGSRRTHVELYGHDLGATEEEAVVWLQVLCTVAVKLTQDMGKGPTRRSNQRGVYMEHARVFSGLPEILFNDLVDTSRGKSDTLKHPHKRPPEREERSARDVFTRISIDEIDVRPERAEKERRELGNVPRHKTCQELPSMTAFEFEFGTGEATHVIAAEEHVRGARTESKGVALTVRHETVRLRVGAG